MGEELDWGDGAYARTAVLLEPVAELALDALALAPGERLIDIACGTGNAALAAARRGASALGVDTAAGLVAQAVARAAAEGATAEFAVAGAADLPVTAGSCDAAVSVFGIIFAPDADRAAAELLRCLRPDGRLALTAWLPAGPIAAAGRLLWGALGPPPVDPPRWGDGDWTRELLARHGALEVEIAERALEFTAASAAAWFAEQEAHHPVWRWIRRRIAADAWERLRAESVAILDAGNEAPAGWLTTSRYLMITARR